MFVFFFLECINCQTLVHTSLKRLQVSKFALKWQTCLKWCRLWRPSFTHFNTYWAAVKRGENSEWWHQCGMCYLETPCRFQWEEIISSYLHHSFFPSNMLTSWPDAAFSIQPTLELELFHLKMPCLCCAVMQGMHSLTPLQKKTKNPKTSTCLISPTLSSMATAFAEFQTVEVANLTTCKSRSEEKTYKRPTFRSQAKCLWKSISHSILQAHRTAATSLLTTTDKAASAAQCPNKLQERPTSKKVAARNSLCPRSHGVRLLLFSLSMLHLLREQRRTSVWFGVWTAWDF